MAVHFRGAFHFGDGGNDDAAVTLANARRARSDLRDIARRLLLQHP